MDSMIYNPSEDFDKKYKSLHQDKTKAFFDELVKKSGVDIEANRKTVAEYDLCEATEKKLKKKLLLWRILRVLMIITVILIPVVIWKITPMIKAISTGFRNAFFKLILLLSPETRYTPKVYIKIFVMILRMTRTVMTGESAPNTATARGIPRKPLFEKAIQNRIIPRVFSDFSIAVMGFERKNIAKVKTIPTAEVKISLMIRALSNEILFTVPERIRNGIPTYIKSFDKTPECWESRTFAFTNRYPGSASVTNSTTFFNMINNAPILFLRFL